MTQKEILNNIFHNFEKRKGSKPENYGSEYRFFKDFDYNNIKMLEL